MAVEHDLQSPQVAPRRAAEPPIAATAPDRVGELLSLQRRIGNRAVRRLLRQEAATAPRTVALTMIVEREMTPHEFAVRAYMQAFRVGGDVAEQRVAAIEASGRLAGTGPNFEHGVRADEVGKPLLLNYPLPALSAAEAEDVKGRAQQLAGLPKSERSAIDEETDRRFWEQSGMAKGTKLGLGGKDALHRRLWMRARDSVMRDRNRLESLPARTRELLVPQGREVTPEHYATVLRIADKLAAFSEQDWALYQRRVNASTDEYGRLEESIDRFLARQEREASAVGRIAGTEALYEVWQRYKRLPRNPHYTVGGGVAPAQVPGALERIEKTKAELDRALAASGFRDLAEYEAACTDYLLVFRARAAEVTLLALKASEQVVAGELTRYRDPAEVAALFGKQATLRRLNAEAWEAERRSLPTLEQAYSSGHKKSSPAQEAAAREGVEKRRQAEAERAGQAAAHPILKDPRLHTYQLSVADEGALGTLLREDAAARLANIKQTRSRVYADPEAVYQFDRVVELTLQELGASAPGAAGRLIVQGHVKAIQSDELLKGIGLAVLAIGLGLLSFGTGTVAVLAGAGALGVSVYQVGDEWAKFEQAFAAAHTAFDAGQAVSSDDPTILWLALSLVAIGFEGAALARAMKAAAPAAKVLSETGEVAQFEQALAKATELGEGVRASLAKSARAEKEYIKASEDLARYTAGRLNALGILDPIYLAKVSKVAYWTAAEGIRDFQVFLAKLKVQKFAKGLDIDKLSPAELNALETAFNAGVADFDATFKVSVEYASGRSWLMVGPKGELLLDGRPVGAVAEHAEVMKQLGLTHAYKGHGAKRDVVTIAGEAVKNAATPKGAGMSSIFNSDEEMLRALEAATIDVNAGRGVRSGAYTLVDVPATPSAGRVFVVKSKLPPGATPLNPTPPFASQPDVLELHPTHVRALFTETSPGVFEIADIFPAYK